MRIYADFSNNYYRVGNNHIFLSISGDNIEHINRLSTMGHKHIHLFIADPMFVQNTIEYLIEHTASRNKVIIHVPRFCRDVAVVLRNNIKDLKGNWRIIIDNNDVVFRRSPCDLTVSFRWSKAEHLMRTSANTADHKIERSIEVPSYFYLSINAIIHNRVQLNNLELFKHGILRRFKRSVKSLGMDKSFDNEDQMWEYILDNYSGMKNNSNDTEEEDYDDT